ncbi:MAG: M42 family peptidase [Oscillospiraceae bacterium]|jgi:endoglucanase|nr:M42 family peptidase [Oscillospiraceae bacterium]
MERITNFLRDLCLLNAVSGDELDIRKYIVNALKDASCEISFDNLGNLIVRDKNKKKPKNKIMICAHMDEVGFVVRGITSDGFISLSAVGGISDSVVFGRHICFKSGDSEIYGVIGGKPIHHLDGDEKDKQPKLSGIYADIGANSKNDAEKFISLGDFAYFRSEFVKFGDNYIKGKALDDRLGCAVMLDMILSELDIDMHFVFTVQEEIGARGAGVAAYAVKPDFALVLEATTACDISGVEDENQVCKIGNGTVVPFMDKSTVYDKQLYKLAFETAAENNLKCQTKTQIAGGNDSGTIHKTAGGIRTICLAAPCRYLHSPSCVIKEDDLFEMRILAEKMAYKIAEL